MKFLNKLLRKNDVEDLYPREPFAATIIFECARVEDNKTRVTSAVEEFIGKYIDRIIESPRITQASDGNVIEILLHCEDKEELLHLNKELELVALRYGLR